MPPPSIRRFLSRFAIDTTVFVAVLRVLHNPMSSCYKWLLGEHHRSSRTEILIKSLTLARTLSSGVFGCTGTGSATGHTVTLRFKTLRRAQVTTKEFFHNVRLSTVTAKSDHKSYHLKCLRRTVISNYIRRSRCKNCQFLKPRLWSTTKKKGDILGKEDN